MACQIVRNKEGDVTRVVAANGKTSKAYLDLLAKVDNVKDTRALKQRFASWEGRHIMPITNKRELALALYKQLYSPAFKSWMGDWSKLAEVTAKDPGNGYRIAQLRKEVRVNLLDENGEPTDQALDKVLEGPTKSGLFSQVMGKTQPSAASPETLKKVGEFLDRIGVAVQEVEKIMVNGKRIGATGLAAPMEGLILITQGWHDVALPEEAMHIAVELIQQKNPALFKEMMGKIGNYNLFKQVVQDYKDIKDYQTEDGKPDIAKLKKETIAKVLAQSIIDKNEGTTENQAFLAQTNNWWDKIIEFLKGLFGKAGFNPFQQTVEKILEGKEDLGKASDISDHPGSIYLQKEQETFDKLRKNNANVAKTKDGFEVNGAKVKRTVMEDVGDYLKTRFRGREQTVYNQAFKDAQDETADKMHADIKDILHRYIDDANLLRIQEEPHVNPSAVDPFDNTIYNTVEENIKERLNTYPAGTKFFPNITLYDGSKAGMADLVALTPEGKVDVLQFKVPGLRYDASDIPLYKQESYNIEIESLRGILQRGYGVTRNQFRYTRALPIKISYAFNIPGDPNSGYRPETVKVGGTNVKLITDDALLPIASSSEGTGIDKVDKLIKRLRGLVQKLSDERVSPDKRSEKSTRIATLLASIRKLQVQGKADGILTSGKLIVRRQQDRYARLNEIFEKTEPSSATLDQLNKIAQEILDEKDQVEIYADLYRILKEVLTDDTEKDKEDLQKAREISDDAQDVLSNFWDLSVKFRTKKLAAKFGIRDEFDPEKQLTWYRRMVRSLSQSSIKAGAILWELVNGINNRFHLDFNDRLDNLLKIEKGVKEWMRGKTEDDLYKKILQIDKDGKWNGKFIQQYSKDFYKQIREAQERSDAEWVKDNIDMEAYTKWYEETLEQVKESYEDARLAEDDNENEKRIQQQINEFQRNFDPTLGSAYSQYNYRLKDYPLLKWESSEYQELKKPGNTSLLELYNYWRDKLKESLDAGMIEEHNGWSWFPNVRKNRLEKLSAGDVKGIFQFRHRDEESEYSRVDPITGKPIDEIHANYVRDLGEWIQDANGNYFMDYSQKSMDIFKVMALWEREIAKFKLKTESEGLARMLAYTEQGQGRDMEKGGLQTTRSGKLVRDTDGSPIIIDNEKNARYIKEHIDAVYYSKGTSNESDFALEIPLNVLAEKVNKIFGKEVLDAKRIGSISLSGANGLAAVNRYFMTKTLGLNVFTAAANLFGGTVNTYINQGKYFNKMDISEAEIKMTSARWWGSEENKKLAGLLGYFHPFLEDKTNEEIKKLSLSGMVKYLSSDRLFFMQRWSDEHVNQVIATSFIMNAMVKDGKILNIREYARKELGYENKYAGSKKDAEEFDQKLEKRVEEIKKSPEALLNYVKVQDDHIQVPGVDRQGDQVVNFRRQILEFIKDALGNTSREDLSLYKRSVIMQSFFMFKNWIPRMVDVRGQSLKYNPGSQQYEWGRVRMLVRAVGAYISGTVGNLKKDLGGGHSGLVALAKKLYAEKQAYFAEQGEEFTMNEAEFVDMYIKGVRAEMKELLLGLGLMGILFAARAARPPKDDDEHTKGMYKHALRALDKLQDEVNFFYNPSSFTDIVNGSTFPAVGVFVDIERLMKTAVAKLYYEIAGDQKQAEKEKISRYVFKILPITKELATWIAVFNADFAKDYGVKISSQNGSSR